MNIKTMVKWSLAWRWMLRLARPMVALVWAFSHGAKAHYLHLRYFTPPVEFPALQDNGLEICENDPDFKSFALWLRAQIPEALMERERVRMQEDDDDQAFTCDLLPYLTDEVRLGILRFALSDRAIGIVRNYFKFVPRLATTFIMLNVPKNRSQKGSQKWHRDGLLHKGFNFFICLSDVDEASGIYSAIGKNWIPEASEIPIIEPDMTKIPWDRYRITDEEMSRFVPPEAVTHLAGPLGTAALVDPAWCYHKGGHCISRERLMVQISYQTETQPNAVRPDNILRALGLDDHPELNNLLDTPIRRYLVGGFRERTTNGAFFHKLSRLLSYYMQPLQFKRADE